MDITIVGPTCKYAEVFEDEHKDLYFRIITSSNFSHFDSSTSESDLDIEFEFEFYDQDKVVFRSTSKSDCDLFKNKHPFIYQTKNEIWVLFKSIPDVENTITLINESTWT